MSCFLTSIRIPLRSPACLRARISVPARFLTTKKHAAASEPKYLLEDSESGLGFIRSNPQREKPRKLGMTEIRGPYYAAYGSRHLRDIMETMGSHVDGLKFAGGSFALMPEKRVREMTDIAHENDVYVSTVRKMVLWSGKGRADQSDREASWNMS